MKERELDIRSAKVKVPLYFKVFYRVYDFKERSNSVSKYMLCLPHLDTLI